LSSVQVCVKDDSENVPIAGVSSPCPVVTTTKRFDFDATSVWRPFDRLSW